MMYKVDELRIKRLDPQNICLQRLGQVGKRSTTGQRQWQNWRYYGKIEDLARDLITLVSEVEDGDNLTQQIEILAANVAEAQTMLIEHLKTRDEATDNAESKIEGD